MTNEQKVLLQIKETIADMPHEQRKNINECRAVISVLIDKYPAGEAMVAVAYFAAKFSAEIQINYLGN